MKEVVSVRKPLIVLTIIVASFVLGGCGGREDKLERYSSGESLPELTQAAQVMGLSDATVPRDEYIVEGYVGVAPLEELCIVLFMDDGTAASTGSVTALVESRYEGDEMITYSVPQADPDLIGEVIEAVRPNC